MIQQKESQIEFLSQRLHSKVNSLKAERQKTNAKKKNRQIKQKSLNKPQIQNFKFNKKKTIIKKSKLNNVNSKVFKSNEQIDKQKQIQQLLEADEKKQKQKLNKNQEEQDIQQRNKSQPMSQSGIKITSKDKQLVVEHFLIQKQHNKKQRRFHSKNFYKCKHCSFKTDRIFNAKRHIYLCKQITSFQEHNGDEFIDYYQDYQQKIPQQNIQEQFHPTKESIIGIFHQLIQSNTTILQNVNNNMIPAIVDKIWLKVLSLIEKPIKTKIQLQIASKLNQQAKYKLNINKIALDISQSLSQLNFSSCFRSFKVQLAIAHQKIMAKEQSSRTKGNNVLCFKFFNEIGANTLRNTPLLIETLAKLSRFRKREVLRYYSILVNQNHYFKQFPDLPVVRQQHQRRVRSLPLSISSTSKKIAQIWARDRVLATDMWMHICLALRASDIKKLIFKLQDSEQYPKIIRLIQNKTKTQTARYIPVSLLYMIHYSKATFPMTSKRQSRAVKECLIQFKSCYGFRHRLITEIINVFAQTSALAHFHNRFKTTSRFYLDPQHQELIQKIFGTLSFQVEACIKQKVKKRNKLLDITDLQSPKLILIEDKQSNSVVIRCVPQIEEILIETVYDQGNVTLEEINHVKSENLAQSIFLSQNNLDYTAKTSNCIQDAVSDVCNFQEYNIIENVAIDHLIQKENSIQRAFVSSFQNIGDYNVAYAQFNTQEIKPTQKYIKKKVQDIDIAITKNTRQGKTQYNISLRDKVNFNKKFSRNKNKFNQNKSILAARKPRCQQCTLRQKISHLQYQRDQRAYVCPQCGFTQQNTSSFKFVPSVVFSSKRKQQNLGLSLAQSIRTVNNIKKTMGDRFSLTSKVNFYEQTIETSFAKIQDIRDIFYQYQLRFDRLPYQIRDSTIAGANKGFFTTIDLEENTFVSYYNGLVSSIEHLDTKSDSLWSLGWIEYNQKWFQVCIDGNVLNNGSRYINHSELSNCKTLCTIIKQIPYVIIYTSKRVSADSQLFINYGLKYNFSLFES